MLQIGYKQNQPTKIGNYRSKLEGLIATLLDKHGIKFTYEDEKLEYTYPIRSSECSDCGSRKVAQRRTYLPDFTLEAGKVYLEGKGILTAGERGKFLQVKKQYPDRTIVFVFGANNKLNKNKPERYSDWCTQHGFEFGVLGIPQSLITRYGKKSG